MVKLALQILSSQQSLRTLMIHGSVGCGKTTWLQKAPALFSHHPVLHLPAYLPLERLTESFFYSTPLLSQAGNSLLLLDDAQRMDPVVLSLFLKEFEKKTTCGYLIASFLETELPEASLRDRFALSAAISTPESASYRPRPSQESIVPELLQNYVCTECQEQGYPGHRAEFCWYQAAHTLAQNLQETLSLAHLEVTRGLALSHRIPQKSISPDSSTPPSVTPPPPVSGNTATFASGTPRNMPSLQTLPHIGNLEPLLKKLRAQALLGKKKRAKQFPASSPDFKSLQSLPSLFRPGKEKPHLGATLRKAMPWQVQRGRLFQGPLILEASDWMEAIWKPVYSCAMILVIDATGSMHQPEKIVQGREIFNQLTQKAYPKKERVALLTFKDEALEITVPLGGRWHEACQKLDHLQCHGKSPLDKMFFECYHYANALKHQPKVGIPNWIFLSDFRPNHSVTSQKPIDSMMSACEQFSDVPHPKCILDAETGRIQLGLGKRVAQKLQALYFPLHIFQEK